MSSGTTVNLVDCEILDALGILNGEYTTKNRNILDVCIQKVNNIQAFVQKCKLLNSIIVQSDDEPDIWVRISTKEDKNTFQIISEKDIIIKRISKTDRTPKEIKPLVNKFNVMDGLTIDTLDLSSVTTEDDLSVQLFKGSDIRKIILPKNIEKSTSAVEMYASNSAFERFDRDFDASNLVETDSMFSWCSALKEVTIDLSSAEDTRDMFYCCDALKKVIIYNLNSVVHMDGIFGGCNNLEEIHLYNVSLDNLELTETENKDLITQFLSLPKLKKIVFTAKTGPTAGLLKYIQFKLQN